MTLHTVAAHVTTAGLRIVLFCCMESMREFLVRIPIITGNQRQTPRLTLERSWGEKAGNI